MEEIDEMLKMEAESEQAGAEFQEILETKKDDPEYRDLIIKYNELKEKVISIMEAGGDISTAFKLGKEAGVTENRIWELYEGE